MAARPPPPGGIAVILVEPSVPPSRPEPSAGQSPLRITVERRSAVVLVYLRSLPRAVPALIVVAVAAVGLLATGLASALALLLVLAVLCWLAYLSWPALPPGGRAVRVLTLGLLTAAVLSRITA